MLLKMAIKYGFSLSLLVIQIVLSLLFSSHHFAKANNELSSLVTLTCNHTEFPDVCISTLESDPHSSIADLTNLSRIALEIAVTKANETKVDTFKLFNNATSDESQETRLACYEYGFNSTVYQFKENLQYLDKQNYTESSKRTKLASALFGKNK